MNDEKEVEAIGWHAIDEALRRVHGLQEPRHFGTVIPTFLGGKDPIQGISVYSASDPIPHWHFVTYGFSELYEKESDDPAVSGYRFELTLRLKKGAAETEPPPWPLNFLQNLGRYVFSSGNAFSAGHYLDLNGPIALEHETSIRAVALETDAPLGEINTPNGRVAFLQIVGITLDELRAIRGWNTTRFLEVFEERIPGGITDLERGSILAEPAVQKLVEAKTAAEGSSTGVLYVSRVDWRRMKKFFGGFETEIVLGANGIRDLPIVLPGRIPFGRELTIVSNERLIVIRPGDETACSEKHEEDIEVLTLVLTKTAANELAATLRPRAGTYSTRSIPGISFRIEPSPIRNQDGEVAEVIG